MVWSKSPILSNAGKRGFAYVSAFAFMIVGIAVTPLVIASNLQSQLLEKGDMVSLLARRIDGAKSGTATNSPLKVEAGKTLFHGETVGIISAEMQRHVAAIADAAGLHISRIEPVNASQNESAVALQLELEAEGKTGDLQEFLYALEAGKPFVFVNEANISAVTNENTSGGEDRQLVRMTLEATGWIGRI